MRVAAVVLLGIGWAGVAAAQVAPGVWPRCIAARDGQEIGVGGSICECRYEAGGSMLRRPAGWRWSCDIMRMDRTFIEPELAGRASQLPPGFVYAPQGNIGAMQQPTGPTALFDGRHR